MIERQIFRGEFLENDLIAEVNEWISKNNITHIINMHSEVIKTQQGLIEFLFVYYTFNK